MTTKRDGIGTETEGSFKRDGYIYPYGWLMLLYGRKQHKNVKQLSSNEKKKKEKILIKKEKDSCYTLTIIACSI